jgi:phosphoribosyl-ATP pyrophosphohydrolase/phosphoribosyl-AMP cyclohydrolase
VTIDRTGATSVAEAGAGAATAEASGAEVGARAEVAEAAERAEVGARVAVAEASGAGVATAATVDPWRRPGGLRFGDDGLAPAIVQDAFDGRVLMLAWMDSEALDATLTTGEVHFHSRSRDRLWRKGETSGNVLRLVALAADCDRDALLVTVEPTGPTCHRGTRSCFDPDGAPGERTSQGFAWLEALWSTIVARATDRPEGSYTARLLEGGVDAIARKVTEEATEVLMAAKDDAAAEATGAIGATDAIGGTGTERADTKAALAGEAADLLYHTLVLLTERGVAASSVLNELRARHQP